MLAPDESRPWADHSVAPAHYIYSVGEFVNLRVGAGDVGEAYVSEVAPVVTEEFGAAVFLVAHWVIVGPDGGAVVDAFLVSGVDVA